MVTLPPPADDETPDDDEMPDEDEPPDEDEAPDEALPDDELVPDAPELPEGEALPDDEDGPDDVPVDDDPADDDEPLVDRSGSTAVMCANLAPMTAAAAAESKPTRQVIFLTLRRPSSRARAALEYSLRFTGFRVAGDPLRPSRASSGRCKSWS